MKLYSENKDYKLYEGSMLDMLEVIEPNTIDSIVTDPPYELNFMGKGWDNSGIAFQPTTWQKCYEVLKPGGYLLAFGGSRTFHRIAVAIEDAGFEIRDTIMWLYGSGFPKSMNIGLAIDKKNGVESKVVGYEKTTMPDFRDVGKKQKEISGIDKLTFGQIENSERKQQPIYEAQNEWQGWGTALKPSFEPIIVARKPFKGSLVDNVIENGVGGINIDECRIESNGEIMSRPFNNIKDDGVFNKNNSGYKKLGNPNNISDKLGRFPANTILTYDETDYDEVCGGFPDTKTGSIKPHKNKANAIVNKMTSENITSSFNGDSGSASRYFYCAKASKKDRDEGLEGFKDNYMAFSNQAKAELKRGNINFKGNENNPMNFVNSVSVRKNTHPTVKPTDLMQYLVRLVTPNNGTILDPFNGSGSTGKAVMYENKERNKNYKYIGIELTEEYLPISKARIEYVGNLPQEDRQVSIFDLEESNE